MTTQTFVCGHGTTTTEVEALTALQWAAKQYPHQALVDVGAECWIALWRKEKEEKP